jgi:hypothetical protein
MNAPRGRQVDVPPEVLALATLADPSFSYACEIAVPPGDGRSAEEWARAAFEGAPRALRWFMLTGWIAGLGLRLAPRSSPSHVLGWTVVSTTPSAIVLGVDSFVLTAQLVVRVHDGLVVHATLVRYDRRVARVVWAVAAPIHRRVIPYLLGHAATHVGTPTS